MSTRTKHTKHYYSINSISPLIAFFLFVLCVCWLFFVKQHVGDGECTVFVKVLTSKDRWARSGWCFETRFNSNGRREAVLEHARPPRREVIDASPDKTRKTGKTAPILSLVLHPGSTVVPPRRRSNY